jgi:hypothetical protein
VVPELKFYGVQTCLSGYSDVSYLILEAIKLKVGASPSAFSGTELGSRRGSKLNLKFAKSLDNHLGWTSLCDKIAL